MMLGQWANELDGIDLLDMYATEMGVGNIASDERLKSKGGMVPLPPNKMSDYDRGTTIMTFKFDRPHEKSELPHYFTKDANGIIMGESNIELILQKGGINPNLVFPSTEPTIGCATEVKQPEIPKLNLPK